MDISHISNLPHDYAQLLLSTAIQCVTAAPHSMGLAISATILVGAYLVHLARGVIAPRTLPNSTTRRPSQLAWSVPLLIISALVVRVVLVLR